MKSKVFLVLLILLSFNLYASPQFLIERKEPKFLLVTGCARSGTTYISDYLRACGIEVPHEAIGRDGSVSWPMAVNSKTSPWGPSCYGLVFTHTFHQVRHPLKTISSVYSTEPHRSWAFICKQVPEIKYNDPPLVRAAKYWYYWNLCAESKSEWTYRIEDLENILEEMEGRLGRHLSREILATIPKNTNTRNPNKKYFTWEDLQAVLEPEMYQNIRDLAKRYGYKVDG